MKVFALFALVPFVAAGPAVPFTAFGGHAVHHAAPAIVHHAKVHHAPVHHAPVHHTPVYKPVHHTPVYHKPAPVYHQPHYGYEQPKHNCSVQDVVESAEVC